MSVEEQRFPKTITDQLRNQAAEAAVKRTNAKPEIQQTIPHPKITSPMSNGEVNQEFMEARQQKIRTDKVKQLFKPENFKEASQDKIQDTGNAYANIMAEEFAADFSEFTERDVATYFRKIANDQARITIDSDQGVVIAEPASVITNSKDFDTMADLHGGYMARELSEKSGIEYDSLLAFIVDSDQNPLIGDLDTVTQKFDIQFPNTSIGNLIREKYSWGVVGDSKDKKHVLANYAGVAAAKVVLLFAEEKLGMTQQQVVEIINHDSQQLLLDIHGQDEKAKALLRFAVMAAKTSWIVSTLQKGITEGRPDRYDPAGSKGLQIDTFKGMVLNTLQKDGKEGADLEAIRDIEQIKNFLRSLFGASTESAPSITNSAQEVGAVS